MARVISLLWICPGNNIGTLDSIAGNSLEVAGLVACGLCMEADQDRYSNPAHFFHGECADLRSAS